MTSIGSQINYKQLLDRHGMVRVPMIQRDYAQGRPSEAEVRDAFLGALEAALRKPADDPGVPLNLDFIYGSVEGEDGQSRFLPLDGQQRLTTLYLLHWYLAWKDDEWSAFEQVFLCEGRSRFAYSTRPSSNEFFDALACYRPESAPVDVSDLAALIIDQPWYFRSWRLDPSIQAVLYMLNAIHRRFGTSEGLFARLMDVQSPAITFQLLDLHNFGLSDDLYIKMNARGKPLTAFEMFKARYEESLESQLEGEIFELGGRQFDAAGYIARCLDTNWADLFWNHRIEGSDIYDDAFMNVFRAVALVSRSPESRHYLEDVGKLRSGFEAPSYHEFHVRGWLDESFTCTLVALLDAWCAPDGKLCRLLPGTHYFDEFSVFNEITADGVDRATLSYAELVQFVAYVQFILAHGRGGIDCDAFQEWMRIIRNLSVNTAYNRPGDFRRSVQGILRMLDHGADILSHMAQAERPATGFSEMQLEEEKLKAKLIRAHDDWRQQLDRAEGHGYFRGQVGFLLDFAGVTGKCVYSAPESWETSDHKLFQTGFARSLELAESMFSAQGLVDPGECRWQRSLLALGDYLLPSGRNRSFLVNAATEEASWKRLLSGAGYHSRRSRDLLKALFSRLSPGADIAEQLDRVIKNAYELDAWRHAVVHCPEILDYCDRKMIRVDERGHIYLLKRSQMNGAHAELFTFHLYKKLSGGVIKLSSLKADYQSVNDTYSKPHIQLKCDHTPMVLTVEPGSVANEFLVKVPPPDDETLATLFSGHEFERDEGGYQRAVGRDSMEDFLRDLDMAIHADLSGGENA